MKKLREMFLIDEWKWLYIRHIYFIRLKHQVTRTLKLRLKYEVSKKIAQELHKEFINRYPDSPLNK